MQQYIKNTKNLIDYFLNLLELKLLTLYTQDTVILIATYLDDHPEKKESFYGESIASAVNFSKNALGIKGDENLFILFNRVINYDHAFMHKHSLICEMRNRLELLYSRVTVFNYNRNADETNKNKNKSMDDERVKIYEAFRACVNYYYCFFEPFSCYSLP